MASLNVPYGGGGHKNSQLLNKTGRASVMGTVENTTYRTSDATDNRVEFYSTTIVGQRYFCTG